MSSSEDAYGVFTHDTDGDEVDLGQGAIYGAGLLRFWKDKIFVRIMADRETPEAKAVVMGFGAKIAGAIPGEGEKPGLDQFPPGRGPEAEEPALFSHPDFPQCPLLSGQRQYLEPLSGNSGGDGPVREGRLSARVLLVEYPAVERAVDAEGRFAEMFLLERFEADRKVPPKKLEDGKFAGVVRRGRHLIIVIEAEKKSGPGMDDRDPYLVIWRDRNHEKKKDWRGLSPGATSSKARPWGHWGWPSTGRAGRRSPERKRALVPFAAENPQSVVVLIRNEKAIGAGDKVDAAVVQEMIDTALKAVLGGGGRRQGLGQICARRRHGGRQVHPLRLDEGPHRTGRYRCRRQESGGGRSRQGPDPSPRTAGFRSPSARP